MHSADWMVDLLELQMAVQMEMMSVVSTELNSDGHWADLMAGMWAGSKEVQLELHWVVRKAGR